MQNIHDIGSICNKTYLYLTHKDKICMENI